MAFDSLFSPIKVRDLTFKNRVIMPGMNTLMVRDTMSEQTIAYYVERAKGGCGAIILEATAVHETTHSKDFMPLYKEEHIENLKKLTDAVHEAGGLIGVQLLHAGLVATGKVKNVMSTQAMTIDDIKMVVEAYKKSAKYSVDAGFDFIEFHAAHTYLPHEFLSAGLNRRTDEYNGDLKARAKFPLECITAIRSEMPEGMPLFMRVNGFDDFLPKGLTKEETIEFINMAETAGVDMVDLSRGNVLTFALAYEVPPINIEQGWNIDDFAEIGSKVNVMSSISGRIIKPEMADEIVASGKADFVVVGRGQIADPHWCNKARDGRSDEIIACIGCMQACYDIVDSGARDSISCLRNPKTSKEFAPLEKVDEPKTVYIAGGGMAGMYTAMLLEERGHKPVIFEKSASLGGQFYLAGLSPSKAEIAEAVKWQAEKTMKLGIDVRLNSCLDAKIIEEDRPDAVVIAVGSAPFLPPIKGADLTNVHFANDVLANDMKFEGEVAVIGGGSVGVEVAEFVAHYGAKCALIEMTKSIGTGYGRARKMFAKKLLKDYGINVLNLTACKEIKSDGIICVKDGEEFTLPCQNVILATGSKPLDSSEIMEICESFGIQCEILGDAKEVRDAFAATSEAYEIAVKI